MNSREQETIMPLDKATSDVRLQTPDLQDLIDSKIETMIEDAHAGGWTTDDALMAIEQVVARRWLRRRDATRNSTTDQDFVSDGNEG